MGLIVKLYSDFVCPFCFIAEQSVLARLQSEYDLQVDWRGFELHPETPLGGVSLDEMFPGGMLDEMRTYMIQFAEKFGIQDVRVADRLPNTRRALAVTEWARAQGRHDAFRDEAMHGYWKRGLDLENPQHLRDIIHRAGLDPARGLAAMDDPEMLARVEDMREEASKASVTGIPTFIFGETETVEGCQPYELMEAAALAAGARRQSAN